jgi:hypothetical protein
MARLDEPMTALRPLRGLVVVEDVPRRPGLFPVLRVLADRKGTPARFLILGSASANLWSTTARFRRKLISLPSSSRARLQSNHKIWPGEGTSTTSNLLWSFPIFFGPRQGPRVKRKRFWGTGGGCGAFEGPERPYSA